MNTPTNEGKVDVNSPPTFSLLNEPWISCDMEEGGAQLLSIRDVFDGEHAIKGIRGDSPAQDYAVLRVLLAIFWRAHYPDTRVGAGGTFDFADWFNDTMEESGDPDKAVLDYLDAHADRFDLLHPATPFMQVADLHTQSGSSFGISRIVPEAEEKYFTMRAGAGRESLEFAEAARWLIYTQAYDYSGIKSGAVGDSRVKGGRGYPIGTGWSGRTGGTVVVGEDLRQTLILNTTQESLMDPDDLPVWERQPDTAAERDIPQPVGPSDLATWQARRVRMDSDGERIVSVLVSNGDRIPEAGANVLNDPMTPYRYSKNKSKPGKPVYYAQPFDPNRTMWRSLEPLISLDRDPGFDGKNVAPKRPRNLSQLAELAHEIVTPKILDLQLVSVTYGAQDSSVATTVSSRLELPVSLLAPDAAEVRAEVIDTAQATSRAAVALGQFAGHLLEAAGGGYEFRPDPTDGILAEIEPRFVTWLGRLDTDDVEKQAKEWQVMVRSLILQRASELMRGAGPKALAGREVSDLNGNIQIRSAGSAYRMLQSQLRKILTLIESPSHDKEKER